MTHWLYASRDFQQRGISTVAVTVVATRGSVPREAGTRMLVTPDSIDGTIGGGHLEFKAIEIARDMLRGISATTVRRFPLAASLGQCCGGIVHLLFEPVALDAAWVAAAINAIERVGDCAMMTALKGDTMSGKFVLTANQLRIDSLAGNLLDAAVQEVIAARQGQPLPPSVEQIAGVEYFVETLKPVDFPIVLFGAGHVGRALVNILSGLASRIRWIDSRESEFPANLPANVEMVVADEPVDQVAVAQAGSYFLVMTHSHPLDQAIAEAILKRGDFVYFGLIGSLTKRRLFEKRLRARGIDAACLALMTCPIGIPQITGKDPVSIAIAVAAEVIQRREQWVAAEGALPVPASQTPAPAGSLRQKDVESRASA